VKRNIGKNVLRTQPNTINRIRRHRYATFAEVAGADPTDHAAAAAGLPPIDSVSVLKYITGEAPSSPRTVSQRTPHKQQLLVVVVGSKEML
jgi:hypothetical protein